MTFASAHSPRRSCGSARSGTDPTWAGLHWVDAVSALAFVLLVVIPNVLMSEVALSSAGRFTCSEQRQWRLDRRRRS